MRLPQFALIAIPRFTREVLAVTSTMNDDEYLNAIGSHGVSIVSLASNRESNSETNDFGDFEFAPWQIGQRYQ